MNTTNKDYIPFTGKEYLESINDDREVYLYGKRVKNITEHPAFRNSARMIARMYDALHDPVRQAILTTPTEWGGFTHRFYRAANNIEEQVASRDAIAEWQRLSWGWMGRSPDYKGCFLGTLGANADFYKGFEENARNWYRKAQEKTLYINHAIMNPPVDRSLGANAGRDFFIRVTRENDAGIYVTGAKVVATNSMLTHYTFIGHAGQVAVQDPAYSPVFLMKTNSPGVKMICRVSNEHRAAVLGSPFDYPLSSRLDENDAILIMDNVFVPWENVLIHNNLEQANAYNIDSGYLERASMHGCTRFAVKLDFMVGALARALEITGSDKFHGVMSQLGEVIAWRNTFWALSDAMAKSAQPWNGMIRPAAEPAGAYRVMNQLAMPKIKNIIEQIVASGLIYLNSHSSDFKNPTVRAYLDQYARGSYGISAEERVKVMKLLWDAIGTEFGARHELYEINYIGSNDATRQTNLFAAQGNGLLDYCKAFAQTAMDDYDLSGWTAPDLVNPDDVSILTGENGSPIQV
jgi:4-hydroxyphenylacetate 3-monooxygenase